MPKQTLALTFGLVLITFILFVIALNTSKSVSPPPPPAKSMQSGSGGPSSVPANSVLSLSPKPVIALAGQKGDVVVNLDTSSNAVTAIQLEIAYDPNFITNVKVVPGGLFTNPVVLIDKNKEKEGRYTYAYGIMPNHSPIKGAGPVANITFTALNRPGEKSQLTLMPNSLVTAQGISDSVLKLATGTLVQIK
jgi:hypothetical protein